jgi:anti-anti-sigma regulatory factor
VGTHRPERIVVRCDVSAITDVDAVALDALARLQLTAHRVGVTLTLYNADRALADLIRRAGLSGVLPVVESGVEVDGQVEQREEVGVDEEVHRRDGAV